MILSEEEAKTKWCPAIHTQPSGEYGNRQAPASQGCIASECMAWRWTEKPKPADHAFVAKADPIPGSGFCGLAGRPE